MPTPQVTFEVRETTKLGSIIKLRNMNTIPEEQWRKLSQKQQTELVQKVEVAVHQAIKDYLYEVPVVQTKDKSKNKP